MFFRVVLAIAIVVIVLLAIPMGIVVFAASPWNTVPTTAEAVGVWQVGNTDERMTLYPSHRITLSNIPKGILEGDGGNNDRNTPFVSATGTWTAFSNDGYGPSSFFTYDRGGDGNRLASQWFGAARELVIDDFAYAKPIELVFHRISATP